MEGFKEFQGKDLDDAIAEACGYFNAAREKLEIEIVQDAKSGIFGIVGARKAKVRARRVQLREAVENILGRKNGGDAVESPVAAAPPGAEARHEASEAPAQQDDKRGGRARGRKPRTEEGAAANGEGARRSRDKAANGQTVRNAERGDRTADKNGAARPEPAAEKPARSGEADEDRGSGHGTDGNSGHTGNGGHGGAKGGAKGGEKSGEKAGERQGERGRDRSSARDDKRQEPRSRKNDARQDSRNESRGPARDAARHERPLAADMPPDGLDDDLEEATEGLPSTPLEQLDPERLEAQVREAVQRLVRPIVGEDVTLSVTVGGGRVQVGIDCGEDSGLLIGREGQTLAALQYMISRVVSRGMNAVVRVQLDAGDYRLRQDEKLREMALALADKVRQSGRSYSTRPLSSYHRRIVHVCLQDAEDVQTRSTGDGPMKRVVIMRRKGAPRAE